MARGRTKRGGWVVGWGRGSPLRSRGTGSHQQCRTSVTVCRRVPGPSFVLCPSFFIPVFALEGHQKLAGKATMTFPELALRSAGGGYQKLLSEVLCKAAPESCCSSKKVLIKVVPESLPKLLPKAQFPEAASQSCSTKHLCKAVAPKRHASNLFPKVPPQSYSPKRLPKAAPQSCVLKLVSLKLLPKAAVF